LIIYLLIERFAPGILGKIYPAWMAEKKHQRELAERALAEAAEEKRRAEVERRETEDRLFQLVQAVIGSNERLDFTLKHISEYLQGQSVFMREMSLDLARMYTFLRIERDPPQPPPVDPKAIEKGK
jgi:hypothetical protein